VNSWRVVLTVAVLVVSCGGPPPVGPLGQPEHSAAWGWSTSEPVGQQFTDGQILLFVPEGIEVTLTGVEPLLFGDGLAPLGVMVAGPDRQIGAVQQIESWPPADPELGVEPVPAIGAVLAGTDAVDPALPHGRGWELLVGYEVTAPGRTTVQGYRVTYLHDGRPYSLVIGSTLAVCASPTSASNDDECEPEETIRYDHREAPATF
jgi:hypothetical protein